MNSDFRDLSRIFAEQDIEFPVVGAYAEEETESARGYTSSAPSGALRTFVDCMGIPS